MTKLTNHELCERLLQANPDEPDVDGLVFGEGAIAKAAGYRKARYFSETYLTDVITRSALGPHVLSQHTPFGHYYQVGSEVVTHLSSGAAFGDNIRGHVRQQRGASVPGWHKQVETTIVGSSFDGEGEGPAFRLYGSDGQ